MFTKFISKFLTYDECNSIIEIGTSIELNKMKSSKIINGKVVENNTTKWNGNKRLGGYIINDIIFNQIDSYNLKIFLFVLNCIILSASGGICFGFFSIRRYILLTENYICIFLRFISFGHLN